MVAIGEWLRLLSPEHHGFGEEAWLLFELDLLLSILWVEIATRVTRMALESTAMAILNGRR